MLNLKKKKDHERGAVSHPPIATTTKRLGDDLYLFTYVRLSQHVQVVELFPVADVNVTRVLITVVNVNEPAIFVTKPQPYLATLMTNVIPGIRLIQLQAYDPDEGAVVGYSLTSGLSNTHTHAHAHCNL